MADIQEDVYVRKDVFNARMDRMEMLLEKTVLEIKTYVDKSTGELKTYVEKSMNEMKSEITEVKSDIAEVKSELKNDIAGLKGEVRALTTKVDALEQTLGTRIGTVESMLTWWITLFAAVIALTTIFPPFLAFLKEKFRPSASIEDMKALTERVANLEVHLSGGK